MRVKVKYSKSELNYAVEYISKHNENFKGEKSYIRQRIIETIREMANTVKPVTNTCSMSTMGFVVHVDYIDLESMDNEDNSVLVEILVNPAVGRRDYSDEDDMQEIVEVDYHDKTSIPVLR